MGCPCCRRRWLPTCQFWECRAPLFSFSGGGRSAQRGTVCLVSPRRAFAGAMQYPRPVSAFRTSMSAHTHRWWLPAYPGTELEGDHKIQGLRVSDRRARVPYVIRGWLDQLAREIVASRYADPKMSGYAAKVWVDTCGRIEIREDRHMYA
jgi:hypothetical protein